MWSGGRLVKNGQILSTLKTASWFSHKIKLHLFCCGNQFRMINMQHLSPHLASGHKRKSHNLMITSISSLYDPQYKNWSVLLLPFSLSLLIWEHLPLSASAYQYLACINITSTFHKLSVSSGCHLWQSGNILRTHLETSLDSLTSLYATWVFHSALLWESCPTE